ncbi:MAG TPA: flippase-like domain-containing protein, partial [Candidatus Acidoferrales bacterium]|nr:flippase-like domain-containing protein [Candidatus Acidoferrales bacterium]
FAFLLYRIGPATVLANLQLVGFGIVPIVGQELISFCANTLGWWSAFTPPRPPIRFRQLLAARMAGDAVNYVTPTATIGGEFVRTRFLRGHATATELVASVTVAKLAQTIGQIVFIVAGLTFIVGETPLPPTVRHGLLSALAGFVLVTAIFFIMQRRGLFVTVLHLLQRFGIAHEPEWAERLTRLDAEIARFHGRDSGPLLQSIACFFVGWCMGAVEIYLILFFLDVPATIQRAVTIEVLSATIDGILFFVPAKAGTQEGGKVLIFTLLGLDPAKGLALALLRRIRELTWAAVGLLIWSRRQIAVPVTVSLK